MTEIQKYRIKAKLVGSPNLLAENQKEVSEWEKTTGRPATPPEGYAACAAHALAHLEHLGVPGYLFPTEDGHSLVFRFEDLVYATVEAPTEAAAALMALAFVVASMKSALT